MSQEKDKYKKPKNPNYDSWTAPEHYKMAQDMERDFPRDDRGNRIAGRTLELVLDKRPTIMKPVTIPHVINPNGRLRKNISA